MLYNGHKIINNYCNGMYLFYTYKCINAKTGFKIFVNSVAHRVLCSMKYMYMRGQTTKIDFKYYNINHGIENL